MLIKEALAAEIHKVIVVTLPPSVGIPETATPHSDPRAFLRGRSALERKDASGNKWTLSLKGMNVRSDKTARNILRFVVGDPKADLNLRRPQVVKDALDRLCGEIEESNTRSLELADTKKLSERLLKTIENRRIAAIRKAKADAVLALTLLFTEHGNFLNEEQIVDVWREVLVCAVLNS